MPDPETAAASGTTGTHSDDEVDASSAKRAARQLEKDEEARRESSTGVVMRKAVKGVGGEGFGYGAVDEEAREELGVQRAEDVPFDPKNPGGESFEYGTRDGEHVTT